MDFWYQALDCFHESSEWTGLIMLISVFLIRFSFKFSVRFRMADQAIYTRQFSLLHVKYSVVSYPVAIHKKLLGPQYVIK